MNLAMLLEMTTEGAPERIAVGGRSDGLTYAELSDRVARAGAWIAGRGTSRVAVLDRNSPLMPTLLFAASRLGLPFVPLNYRLAADKLSAILARLGDAVLVGAADLLPAAVPAELDVVDRAGLASVIDATAAAPAADVDPDAVAVLLFTSGTTGDPKAAVLRQRHLASYIISTVEFLGAGEEEAALVSVPPYHVAGIAAVLSSVYAGRRLVLLEAFDPRAWVDLARSEAVTHAMVVPTMLGRILDVVEAEGAGLGALRHLSYGGGRMPVAVVQRAMQLLPGVDLVNAYGLTETSSTIAVLGPDDHRAAWGSDDPAVRRRLASVGRPLPTLEVEIRGRDGRPVPAGSPGEIHVRGEQVSGEYLGGDGLDPDGWFATRDGGWLDEAGYLFVDGRLDDVIVRGGENLSPGEIEEVLALHPGVVEVAVVGLPDTEWGEQVAAAVVVASGATVTAAELQDWVRARLRSSRTPSSIHFVAALPYNDTGKLLRRVLRDELAATAG